MKSQKNFRWRLKKDGSLNENFREVQKGRRYILKRKDIRL